jgi:hypothetical protein
MFAYIYIRRKFVLVGAGRHSALTLQVFEMRGLGKGGGRDEREKRLCRQPHKYQLYFCDRSEYIHNRSKFVLVGAGGHGALTVQIDEVRGVRSEERVSDGGGRGGWGGEGRMGGEGSRELHKLNLVQLR